MPTHVRSTDLEKAIIDGISDGIPLREICRREKIGVRTVYDWRDADPEFAARFGRAREVGFDAIADETMEIADNGTNDWIDRRREDGSVDTVVDHEHVQRSKLRIETRLKLLAKWDPRRYGDKLDVTSDGKALGDRAAAIAEARQRVLEARDGDEAQP